MKQYIRQGYKARNKLLTGVSKITDLVKVTLGPYGRNVMFRNRIGDLIITKDGVSIAKEVELDDPIENMGATLIKNTSIRSNNLVGDGTTTATILAHAIYSKGIELIEIGSNLIEIKKGIELGIKFILEELRAKSIKVSLKKKDLWNVIYTASNGNEEISNLITGIYEDLGEKAVITAYQGNGVETTVTKVKGMQFDNGYSSSYCVNDEKRNTAIYEEPLIFLYNGKIETLEQLLPAIETAKENSKILVVIADDFKEIVLKSLMINHTRNIFSSIAIKTPGFGARKKEMLKDIASLTGATIFTHGDSAIYFGECDSIEVTAHNTTIIGGTGKKEDILRRVAFITAEMEGFQDDSYETEKLEERLGNLVSGVGVIQVGAKSETEGKELLDRVIDAKFAAKAALEEGVVEGGGLALYHAAKSIKHIKISRDIDSGIDLVLEAALEPFKQILRNADIDPLSKITKNLTNNKKGFDIKKNKLIKNMSSIGVIDPFKVVRIALESAGSIVGTLLTTEGVIINIEE